MADLMGGVPDIPQVMIWGPVVVSDNHRVYGKKGMNTPHARATRARADQFAHILQAGSIPRMAAKPDNLNLGWLIDLNQYHISRNS